MHYYNIKSNQNWENMHFKITGMSVIKISGYFSTIHKIKNCAYSAENVKETLLGRITQLVTFSPSAWDLRVQIPISGAFKKNYIFPVTVKAPADPAVQPIK